MEGASCGKDRRGRTPNGRFPPIPAIGAMSSAQHDKVRLRLQGQLIDASRVTFVRTSLSLDGNPLLS